MPTIKTSDKTPKRIAIVPTDKIASKRIYSNFASISNSPHDFTITFCDVIPLYNEQKEEVIKSGTVPAPIQAEIVIPISFVDSLIKALSQHYENYKKIVKK